MNLKHVGQTARANRYDRTRAARLDAPHRDEQRHVGGAGRDDGADEVDGVRGEVDDFAACDFGYGGPEDGDAALESGW